MHLGNLTWPEIESYLEEESLVLVPVGATEQHGPHLPEGTDSLIAESLAQEAAKRAEVICTPTIDIGVSPHHRQFHGTMWVDPDQFRDYMENLSRNLAYHDIDRIIYVNAHGGNVRHLREVGHRLRNDGIIYAIEWMWNDSIRDLVNDLFDQTGGHGGPKETAMIQYLANELVRSDRIKDARDEGVLDVTADMARRYGARIHYDTIDFSASGVFGDQTEATNEKGEQMFEAAVEQLVNLAQWVSEQPFDDLIAKPHL